MPDKEIFLLPLHLEPLLQSLLERGIQLSELERFDTELIENALELVIFEDNEVVSETMKLELQPLLSLHLTQTLKLGLQFDNRLLFCVGFKVDSLEVFDFPLELTLTQGLGFQET